MRLFMTLIIAGYGTDLLEGDIYFATDSHITHGDTILLKGFKKVINIPIILKGANFFHEEFIDYSGEEYRSSCVIAFAGSSLAAQHMINSMTNHLSSLCPIFIDGNYDVAMPCEPGKHLKRYSFYSDDMFLKRNLDDLISADYISKVVLHSIESVIKSAINLGSISTAFDLYKAEFILGVQCRQTRQHYLYKYSILKEGESATVICDVVPKGELAVIGMDVDHYTAGAKKELNKKNNQRDSFTIFSYLNKSIEDKNSIGIFRIGKPSELFYFSGNKLERVKFERD